MQDKRGKGKHTGQKRPAEHVGEPSPNPLPDEHDSYPDDKTEAQRRDGLSDAEIKDLELAGGVAGGMQAGRGGPRPKPDGHSSGSHTSSFAGESETDSNS